MLTIKTEDEGVLGLKIAMVGLVSLGQLLLAAGAGRAEPVTDIPAQLEDVESANGLDAELVDSSPVLQRWLEETPNLLDEIRNTPAVPFRLRGGLASNREWTAGAEDIPLYDRLTLSGDYRAAFDEQSDIEFGASLRYYLLRRGSYFNIAPQLGFRHLDLADNLTEGVLVGLVGTIALAPGTADLVVTYGLLDPLASDEATLGSVTTAYHLSPELRIAGQVNWRNTINQNDIAVGVLLELAL